MKRLIKLVILSTLLFTGISAMPIYKEQGIVSVVSVEAVSKVKLNAKKKTVYKGKTYQLKVSGIKKKVTWSSNNKKVATVNRNGKVTAIKAGKATITAKVAGRKYSCIITVINPKISKQTLALNTGKTATLKVTGGSKIIWSSNNKKVATVDSKGKITAIGKGTATITAKTSGVTLKCKVTVKDTSTPKSTAQTSMEAFNLINKERKKKGLHELKWSNTCANFAKIRAKECLILYGHKRPNGGNGARELGFAGENLGNKNTATKQVDSWMHSTEYKANILFDAYNNGAVVKIANPKNGGYYWVAIFME